MATNDTPAGVASAAMAMIAGGQITSFSDGTTEAQIADELYEDTVEAMLSEHRWRFATAQEELAHVAAEPTGRFTEAWQLPSGILVLSAVTCNDHVIPYDRYGDKIYCDYDENNTLVADYIWRASESEWCPAFKLAVQTRLAALFAPALRADNTLTELLEVRAERQLIAARRIDSQQQSSRKMRTNRYLGARLSSRGISW